MPASTPLSLLVLNAAVTLGALAALTALPSRPAAPAASPPPVTRALAGTSHLLAAARPARTQPHRPPRPVARRRAVAPRPAHRAPARPRTAALVRLSWADSLAAAVARIPGYRPGDARWVSTRSFGHWGTADWYTGIVYVSPAVPRSLLYDVAVHEWSHLLSVRAYAGDVPAATAAMNAAFGGTGLVGAERAADCMARTLGARWTGYTTCQDASWRARAGRLLQDQRL